VLLQLVGLATQPLGGACGIASAIGLRHVLPVQTNKMNKLDSRRSVCSDTAPAAPAQAAPSTLTTDDACPSGCAVVEYQVHLISTRDHLLSAMRLRLACAVRAGHCHRSGQHPQYVQECIVARHAQAEQPVGDTACCTDEGAV
jgi:hypothetical protein